MQADVYSTGTITRIEGPLLFLRRTVNVGFNEAVEVIDQDGYARAGRIAALDDEHITIEVLESTRGLSLSETRVRFIGEPLHFTVGPDIMGAGVRWCRSLHRWWPAGVRGAPLSNRWPGHQSRRPCHAA